MSAFIPTDYSQATSLQAGGSGGGGVTIMQTQFIFPLLKSGEIEQCMSELNVELTKAEMMEPQRHKEKVRKVFWHLLEICCGITEEDLERESPHAIPASSSSESDDTANNNNNGNNNNNNETNGETKSVLEHFAAYPEIHEDFCDLLFFRELRKCMQTCGIYDFSWKDLHQPVSKRFRCQLSAFINLAKFREEQLKVYAELNEPRAQLLLTLEETYKEHEQLTAQLEQVQAESAEKMEEMDRVIEECQQLELEIARCNKLQASKREQAAALKREVNDLKDELASATWALQETQAEEETLLGKVVSSPDRRKHELESKRSELDKEKEEIRNMQDEIQLNKKRTFHAQQAIKLVQDTITLQKQLLEEASKYEKVSSQLEEIRKDIEGNNEKTEEILNQTEEAERAFIRTEEKLAHLRKQGKMKMDAVLDRIDIAKEQLLLVEKERQEGAARVEAGEAEVRAIEEQMKAEKEKTDREIAELIAEYKELEKAFLARNERRMRAIESAMASK